MIPTANITNKIVKLAGFMFLFSLIVPLLNWTFILSGFIDPESVVNTSNNILANTLLFRLGITIELFMSAGLLVLAMCLYAILKTINKNLALLALLLKIMEATIAAIIVLITFIALQFLPADAQSSTITNESLGTGVGFLLNKHTLIYSIPMIFLGLDMMIFSYLFYKSKFIPRILAGFGILSFALVFIHAMMFILTPEYAEMPINQIIFWFPSGIFEIIIGIWFLTKGIRT